MTPETLFNAALDKVESKRIRDWATSPHNYPIWLKIAENAIRVPPQNQIFAAPDPSWLAAFIVATAIGL
jgi:hypothetical protein